MLAVFAGLANVRAINRRTVLKTQAAAVANEELSALKRFDVTALPNQTNGPFLGTVYNAGAWSVIGDASAGHSAPNVLQLAKTTGFSNAVSGRMQFPAGAYSDATLQTKLYIHNDTAAGTAAGIFFRASDAKNGYRFLVAPTGTDLDAGVSGQQNWILEKVVNDSPVLPRILSVEVTGITTNAWYTIKVVAASTSIKTYLDGNGQDSGTLTNADFTDGPAALVGWNGVHASFDDTVTIVGAETSTWDFDADTALPAAWVRLGLNDLADGTKTTFDDNGKLTLTPYPTADSTTLKQATLTITWSQGSSLGQYSTTALIGSSRIGQ